MKLCFTGDVFLGGDLLRGADGRSIDVASYHSADLRIINLEQAVSSSSYVENKGTLYTDPSALSSAKKLRMNVAGLANNHIHDKGLDGIEETCLHLDEAGIERFGAGASISEASRPLIINDEIAIIGYCDYGKPYLKQIAVAGSDKAGINPLRYEKIIEDLNKLPLGMQAVLFFHWGVEHVWLPPHENVALAQKLLNDDRVALIVGMHSHRPQGYIEKNGKRAYMCLGNFLFPNFFITPPAQLLNSSEIPENYDTTRQYHRVLRPTYKKWRFVNRVSLVLTFDTQSKEVNHDFVWQHDNVPRVTELLGRMRRSFDLWILILSKLYGLPIRVYRVIQLVENTIATKVWLYQVRAFVFGQMGLLGSIRYILKKFG